MQPKGVRYGGRKKGTPNKITLDLIANLKAEGFDPAAKLIETHALAMIEFQRASDIHDAIQSKRIDYKMIPLSHDSASAYLTVAQNACKELMKYSYPQRKAVEHSGKDGVDLFQSFNDMVRNVVAKGGLKE